MKNNLRKDYIWNTVGVFAQSAISPLLLVAITRINGIDSAGTFSFAFSLAIIFLTLGMWGGRTYQVSDIKGEFSQRSYLVVRLLLSAVMLIGAILFSLINNYDPLKTAIVLSLVLFKVFEAISDAIYGVMQIHSKLYVAGKSLFYKSFVGFIAFIVVDIITGSILLSCLAIAAVNILIMIFYDLRFTNKIENLSLKVEHVNQYVKNALIIMKRTSPVFVSAFLAVFSLNIPRYFIDIYHGEDNGYFGILAMPLTLIVLLMSFILQPNVVNMSKLYLKSNYRGFNKVVDKIVFVTIFVGVVALIGAATVGVPLLGLIFGVDFTNYYLALMIMLVGGVANALGAVFINVLTIMRHFKTQFYVLLLTNIILIVVSALLIPENGLLAGVSLFTAASILQVTTLIIGYKLILRNEEIAKKT